MNPACAREVMLKPCASCIIGAKQSSYSGGLTDLTEGVIARISDPLFPASTNLCQDLKNKLGFFFNTGSGF